MTPIDYKKAREYGHYMTRSGIPVRFGFTFQRHGLKWAMWIKKADDGNGEIPFESPHTHDGVAHPDMGQQPDDIIPAPQVRRVWVDNDNVLWKIRPPHMQEHEGAYHIHADDAELYLAEKKRGES